MPKTNNPTPAVLKNTLLEQARAQFHDGSVIKAMELLYSAHEADPRALDVLEPLVVINLQLKQPDQAIINLQKLIHLDSKNTRYYDQLANIYHEAGDWEKAVQVYQLCLVKNAELPVAHFNLGFHLSKAGRFQKAIASYQNALRLGIDKPEEVYLNLAVIYSDHLRQDDEAEKNLLQALAIKPDYLPALYNLANLYEYRGDKTKTLEYFQRLLAIQPENAKALARMAHLQNIESSDDPIIGQLQQVAIAPELDYSDKINVLYALGKAFDDARDYDQAFNAYRQANEINALEMPPYDKAATEQSVAAVKAQFSSDWLAQNQVDNDEHPIFISGMFRSGSTLVEQILASHPDITAGGERDFFTGALNKAGFDFPKDVSTLSKEKLHAMAQEYSNTTRELFPDAGRVTDKRPDNFLYLGFIKALFPHAKFIYTKRNMLDNCLSVFFVRLARSMNYAVNLEHIAHYYQQQQDLLAHWQSLFGDDIEVVDYDEVVATPQPAVAKLLKFLDLEWDDACLNFHTLDNTVKTASVWQVRKPLFTTSSGRWKNYQRHIGVIAKLTETQ